MPQWEITVFGRVQGVGFRYFVKRCAMRLGVAGFVKNLFDGSVYIHAEAEASVLESFKEIVRAGNRYSQVYKIVHEIIDSHTDYHGFEIK